ncbi:MAG TPA: copper resistance system multicopper oxidase [Oleiagrimonas sp.]|nr:copper resistance system multicopper oxidase [Oleiagrimonas sp.]
MNQKLLRTGSLDPMLSRRRFVQGLALGGAAAMLGGFSRAAQARPYVNKAGVLSGTDFALDITETGVDFTGNARQATTVNGLLPGPLLRWREGTTVTLRVTNRLNRPTSIHWHGILLPYRMDGVPGISFPGIAPGETFVYRFPVRQSGTYWYHSHSDFQEQTGLYGPLVIDPAGPERIPVDRDYVVMLNDWTDEDPHAVFAHLKKQSDYYNYGEPTVGDFLADVSREGLGKALAERKMWNRMRMSPRDLVDVTGATYTYLMNGTTPAGNWTGLFKPGERVRLRVINGSANSYFDVRIPGLKLTVIAADGQDVEPVEVDEFRAGAAETYDVIVEPREARAYTIFAQSMSRDGYARGTLAPREGMHAEVPALDPLPSLSMVDMMGAMAQGNMGGMHDMEGMHSMHDMSGMQHGGHGAAHGAAEDSMVRARHARTEFDNPNVDMHVDWPRTNLDDPGVGLRESGRRVLTYADLHTIGGSLHADQPVTREIELHLTGNMNRFVWGFDGLKFTQAKPVHFPYGEQVRLILVNDTMMTHPIHLHGMWSELETPDQAFQVRKHTISVQPAQRVTYRVMANAPGRWAYHCHLLYHMEAGMFREVVVA